MSAIRNEDLEDMVENVISKIYMKYKSLNIEKILPYAYRSLENEIKDFWKRKQRDSHLLTDINEKLLNQYKNDKSIEESLVDEDLVENIRKALSKLCGNKKRKILQLKLKGYDSKEIMEKLNISRSAYDTIVFRATQDIKSILERSKVI